MPPSAGPTTIDSLLVPDLKLRSTSATNAKQLERRLSYLWQSAHALLPSNARMAHELTASVMQLVRAHRLELSRAVLDFICERCGALLVPSVSADVRVAPQNSRSIANRKLARARRREMALQGVAERLVNVVRVTCHRCSHANVRCGASLVVKPKAKKRPAETSDAVDAGVKRAKTEVATALSTANRPGASDENEQPVSHAVAPMPTVGALMPQPPSMFAAPPSPPRKLLDGPKKKKKKKTKAPADAAVAAVKSSLSSFLQSFGSGASK